VEPVTLVRVFLASPSDVADERKAVRRVCEETNLNVGDTYRMRFEVVGWETHVPPGAGEPQKLILQYIDIPTMDLFVGIMAARFGMPTAKARAGTEEEYLEARGSYLKTQTPDIWFYFRSDARPGPGDEDQAKLVREFKEQVRRDKHLTRDYSDAAQFERDFRGHLYHWLKRTFKTAPATGAAAAAAAAAGKPANAAEGLQTAAEVYAALSNYEWFHLQQFRREKVPEYKWRESLVRELDALEKAGFLKRTKGAGTPLQDVLPRDGRFRLTDYFELTPRGETYIDRRWQINPKDKWV
jgi:hypothetical protein